MGLTLSRLREGEHSCSPKHFIPQSVLASRNAAVRNDRPPWVPARGKGGEGWMTPLPIKPDSQRRVLRSKRFTSETGVEHLTSGEDDSGLSCV